MVFPYPGQAEEPEHPTRLRRTSRAHPGPRPLPPTLPILLAEPFNLDNGHPPGSADEAMNSDPHAAASRPIPRAPQLLSETLTGDHLDEAYTEWLESGRRQARRGQDTEETDEPLSPRSVQIIHKTVKRPTRQRPERRRSVLRRPVAM